MTPQVRYQVFVSSTYEDLREERQQATQAILEAGCETISGPFLCTMRKNLKGLRESWMRSSESDVGHLSQIHFGSGTWDGSNEEFDGRGSR